MIDHETIVLNCGELNVFVLRINGTKELERKL